MFQSSPVSFQRIPGIPIEYRDMFLKQHPSAKVYFDFDDFRLYAVEITHARLNAGFGKAFWLDKEQLDG